MIAPGEWVLKQPKFVQLFIFGTFIIVFTVLVLQIPSGQRIAPLPVSSAAPFFPLGINQAQFYVVLLYIGTATIIATYWFLKGLLNPLIDAALAVIGSTLFVLLSFSYKCIDYVYRLILRLKGRLPRISIPLFIKYIFWTVIGIGILVLDHFYNTKIYAEDQMTFYSFVFLGRKFWVTEIALGLSCFILFFPAIYLLGVIIQGFNFLFNRIISITIIFSR